ncbi:Clp protease N-terminal domain-containing protein [Streptomyces sp. NPDC048241]|uniref:Clp protease N-terminal domain-containing protein n=1 Tax=Streptomyces sp. NPDC048241 TaxID=3365521 RepID=UPI003710DA0D
MFERFTKDAREVVQGAVAHAERAGVRSIGAEQLLLALLDREGSRASFAFAALGLAERKDSLAEARRRAGLTRADTDALAGLGIDVTEIVSRVEEAHGAGALSGDRRDPGGWSGRRTFDQDAKDVLEGALRAAVGHRDRRIGDEHLLLALTVRPGVPAEVLADHGVTDESLRRVLYGEGAAQAG